MNAATRQRVRERAGYRCEYCKITESDDPILPFHVEHIRAKKHGGSDDDSNLALACNHCNLHKGPNLSGIDPASDRIAELFHPRRDSWDEHFVVVQSAIQGRTAIGRATVAVLLFNKEDRAELRKALEGR